MNGVDQAAKHVRVSWGEYPVPEVEDVAGTITGARQDILHARLDGLPAGQQQRGVEVALNATIITDTLPRVVEFNAPIHAHDSAASLGHQLKNAGGACDEVDGGCPRLFHGLKNAPAVGLHELLVGAGT